MVTIATHIPNKYLPNKTLPTYTFLSCKQTHQTLATTVYKTGHSPLNTTISQHLVKIHLIGEQIQNISDLQSTDIISWFWRDNDGWDVCLPTEYDLFCSHAYTCLTYHHWTATTHSCLLCLAVNECPVLGNVLLDMHSIVWFLNLHKWQDFSQFPLVLYCLIPVGGQRIWVNFTHQIKQNQGYEKLN